VAPHLLLADPGHLPPAALGLLKKGVARERGTAGGVRGKVGTRHLFPQVTADLAAGRGKDR
jgi:hypothetical protein